VLALVEAVDEVRRAARERVLGEEAFDAVLTSRARIAVPSSKRTPSRSRNVYVSPSAETSGRASARSGTSRSPSAPGAASGVSSVRV
jgi:hypothetical protein